MTLMLSTLRVRLRESTIIFWRYRTGTRTHWMDTEHSQDHSMHDGRKVYLETFGCQMNELDSQLVRGQLLALGYGFVSDWRNADVVIYNTCSVREHAEQKVWSRVGEVGVHKKYVRGNIVLGVIGCMAEREGEAMAQRHPQVDFLCGPGELDKVPMLIDNVIRTTLEERGGKRSVQSALQGNSHRRSGTLAAAEDQLEMLDLARVFSPDDHNGSAYVRITRGCNKFCTYCVVPHTRGAEVHRPPDHIVDEVKRLVDAGVVEVTLLGQTVNHYHYDHGAAVLINGVQQPQVGVAVKGSVLTGTSQRVTTFADLLRRIHEEVPALQRLRFVTNFPRDFGNDILEVMRDSPRICRYLHLPVQSGSDRLLKMMNRDYTVAEYRELLCRVRDHLPGVELATDIICGFPTETEGDHLATMNLLRESRCKNAFIFKYSPRPGTAAYDRLPDDVAPDVKKRRNNELLSVQAQVSSQIHADYVGKTVRVFVESVSAKSRKESNAAAPGSAAVSLAWEQPREVTQLTGRTDSDLIVMFEGKESLIGSIVEVRVDSSAPLALFGSLVTAGAITAGVQ
ncbi:MAG: MiaB/RimO family radical SAM methylthiotransferase [Phycisphaera sp.]|nr:MiaB/RimO family radical SAM methylthiotransferase [Phycisphaera sp.]